MTLLALLFTMTAFADTAPTPTPAPKYEHTFSEKGPLCIEQFYGCPDKKCVKPVLIESKVNECTRSKKARAAMGELAEKWTYLRFDHITPPPPAAKATPIPTVTPAAK